MTGSRFATMLGMREGICVTSKNKRRSCLLLARGAKMDRPLRRRHLEIYQSKRMVTTICSRCWNSRGLSGARGESCRTTTGLCSGLAQRMRNIAASDQILSEHSTFNTRTHSLDKHPSTSPSFSPPSCDNLEKSMPTFDASLLIPAYSRKSISSKM